MRTRRSHLFGEIRSVSGRRSDAAAVDAPPGENGVTMAPERKQWKILGPTRLELTWLDFEPRTDASRRRLSVRTLLCSG